MFVNWQVSTTNIAYRIPMVYYVTTQIQEDLAILYIIQVLDQVYNITFPAQNFNKRVVRREVYKSEDGVVAFLCPFQNLNNLYYGVSLLILKNQIFSCRFNIVETPYPYRTSFFVMVEHFINVNIRHVIAITFKLRSNWFFFYGRTCIFTDQHNKMCKKTNARTDRRMPFQSFDHVIHIQPYAQPAVTDPIKIEYFL